MEKIWRGWIAKNYSTFIIQAEDIKIVFVFSDSYFSDLLLYGLL